MKITKGLKVELMEDLKKGLYGGQAMESTHSVGPSRGGSPQ